MRLKLSLSHVDYAALLRLAAPEAGKLAGFLHGSANRMAARAICAGEQTLMQRLQAFCTQHGVPLTVRGISAAAVGDTGLTLTVEATDVDAVALARLAQPMAAEKLADSERFSFLAGLLDTHPGALPIALSALLAQLAPEEREQLLAQTLNAFSDAMMDALENLAKQNGIECTVTALIAAPSGIV